MAFSEFILFPIMAVFMLAGLAVIVLTFVFWIWMIIDAAKRKFKNDSEKIIWILVIVFANWVGALVYFIVVRSMNPKGLM